MANDSNLDVYVRGHDALSPELSRLESKVIRFVGSISAAIAGIRIGTAPIVAAGNFEREMANVAKTTNFSSFEIDRLGSKLLEFSTKVDVSALDLAKIASAAGQQGLGRYGVEGVAKFADSVSRMASTLDITAEKAATSVGKILNIFHQSLGQVEQAVSTFNEVSNNSTASGKELLDVVRRIGDAAGSLDLQGATAVAATGLDFGQSPEVVGTTFSKVFESMKTKADDFAKLLGKSLKGGTKEWLDLLAVDGIKAFKLVLSRFRELDVQSQQKALVSLIGGGRQAALLNKFIQDASNSVLDRNLASAAEGKKGLSALLEQAKVLDTLNAQSKILLNSITKLGIEGSSNILEPLKALTRQLNETLQQPAFKTFVTAVIDAFGDLAAIIVSATKFISSLNVNWQNFIGVLKLFVGLKLVEAFAGLASRISFFGLSLQSISNQSIAAAAANKVLADSTYKLTAAEQAATLATKGTFLSRLAGYTEAMEAYKKYSAATKAVAAAEAELRVAQGRNAVAQNFQQAAVAAVAAPAARTNVASQAAQSDRAALTAAEQAAATAVASAQQARLARIQVAEQAHAQRLLDIEAKYQQGYAAIKATGTRVGLTALKATRTAELATEETYHERSLRSIEQNQARRIAAITAGENAAVVARRAALMTSLQNFDTQNQDLIARERAAAGANAAAASAGLGVASATGKLDAAERIAKAATGAFLGLGAALNFLKTIALAVGRALLGAFMWLTIIYSVLDALGVIEKLGPAFQRVTDYIGISSEAKRKEVAATKAVRDEYAKLIGELDTLTASYRSYLDASGNVDKKKLAADIQIAKSGDTQASRTAALDRVIASTVAGVKLNSTSDGTAKVEAEKQVKDTQAKLDVAKRTLQSIEDYKARVDATNAKLAESDKKEIAPQTTKRLTDAKIQVSELTRALAEQTAQVTAFGKVSADTATKTADYAQSLGGIATPASLKLIDEFAIKFKKLGDARKAAAEVNLKAQSAGPGPAADAAKRTFDAAFASEEAAQIQLRENIKEAIKGLEGVQRDAFLAVPALLSKENIDKLVPALKKLDPKDLTGALASGIISPDTSGTDRYNPKQDKRDLNDRVGIRRAQFALEKAMADAEANLQQEKNKELEADNQNYYDEGLRLLSEYLSNKELLQISSINAEIASKQRELGEARRLELEAANDGKVADTIRYEAEARKLQGDIEVLKQRKEGTKAEIDREQTRLQRAERLSLTSTENQLTADNFLPRSTVSIFETNLAELLGNAEQQIVKLQANGRLDLASALIGKIRSDSAVNALKPLASSIDLLFGTLSIKTEELKALVADGTLTTIEGEVAVADAIKGTTTALQDKIHFLEQALQANQGNLSLDAYERERQSIEGLKAQLRSLQTELNATALSINQSIGGALENALNKVGTASISLKEIVIGMLLDITNVIKQKFAKAIAEDLMKSLGSNGAGGIGGFFQNLLQGGFGNKPEAGPSSITQTDQKASFAEEVQGVIAPLTTIVSTAFPALAAALGLGTVATTAAATETGFLLVSNAALAMAITTNTAAIIASTATQAAGDATAMAFAFHGGGLAGYGGNSRRVPAGIFNGARRYHGGGLASGEVPAILQKGERVLTAQQDQARMSGAGGTTSIRNVLVADPKFVPDAMATSEGEQVLVSFIRKNRVGIKQLLG